MKHSGRLELTWTDKHKALLSTGDGKYDYTFVDPSDYRVSEVRLLHEVSRHDAEIPAGFEPPVEPTTDNLLITGDAMHALDALRTIPEYADKYIGQVKLCYIDPPFNTGQAFPNGYEDNIEHSIWLTMLRDRLQQIKPLLADDGSVWVHLDDVEVHRCRVVLDEVMGAENFVAQVAWEKTDSPRMDAQLFSKSYDTLLCYRSSQHWQPNRNQAMGKDADFPLTDPHGERYSRRELRKWGRNSLRSDRPTMWYPITRPDGTDEYPVRPDGKDGYWRWSETKLKENMDRIEWVERDGRFQPYVTTYQSSGKKPVPPVTIWTVEDVGGNPVGKAEVKDLFPDSDPFATPKPERLLQRVVHIATNPGDIVLDCFAGSGTTAAVAQKLGRRWVASELSQENVETYAKPRLLKVINGEDPGGISSVVRRVAAEDVELPAGIIPEQAQTFTTLVKKFGDELELPLDVAKQTAKAVRALTKTGNSPLSSDEMKKLLHLLDRVSKSGEQELTVNLMPEAVKAMRSAARTRDETTVNWKGGGGFTHLRVGESMFEEIEGRVFLADWATNGALTRVMCAQLGIRHRPDGIFAGRRGKVRYVVLDGMVTSSTVDAILDQLSEHEIVEVWATQLNVEAAERLQRLRRGSRLRSIPDSVLDGYRRRAAKRSPFKGRQLKSSGV